MLIRYTAGGLSVGPRTPLLTACLLAGCTGQSPSGGTPANAPTKTATADSTEDAATIARLREFKRLVEKDTTADDTILSSLTELSNNIPDDRLSSVERFALSDEGSAIAWPLARLLVDRNRLDAAAAVFVTALRADPENREHRMWKWWEANFGERADYKQLSSRIADSLLKEFEKGPKDRKVVICDLFGKDQSDARLTAVEFRKKLYPSTRGS